MTSERLQYSHCREQLSLNELQQLSVIQAALDYKKPPNAALCQTPTCTSATQLIRWKRTLSQAGVQSLSDQ